MFPTGWSSRAQSGTMLLAPEQFQMCWGVLPSSGGAAALSGVGCSPEPLTFPPVHVPHLPCCTHSKLRTCWSQEEGDGHRGLPAAGPSLFHRPQFARHRFVPENKINIGMWVALQLFLRQGWQRGWTQRDVGSRLGVPIGGVGFWVHDQGPQRNRSMGELFLGRWWRKMLSLFYF